MPINNTLINEKYLPESDAEGIILHWTGGADKANSDDRQHYHIIVNQDGRLVYGVHSIRDNDYTGDNVYAAHTYRSNTRRIGLALSGMAGSVERPFSPGHYPITHAQYEIGCRVAAELCVRYKIDITEKTVLNHGEVESILGIKQRQKWDVMVLPWNLSLNWEQVGKHFRSRVSYYWREMMGLNRPMEPAQPEDGTGIVPEIEVLVDSQGLARPYQVTARSGLNTRVGPGTGHQKAGKALPFGTEVVAITSPDAHPWTKIYHPFMENTFVWVASRYLSLLEKNPVG